jgi:hypothetical protein
LYKIGILATLGLIVSDAILRRCTWLGICLGSTRPVEGPDSSASASAVFAILSDDRLAPGFRAEEPICALMELRDL